MLSLQPAMQDILIISWDHQGTADEAFSVAASIDGMDHNWKFDQLNLLFQTAKLKLPKPLKEIFQSQFLKLTVSLENLFLSASQIAPSIWTCNKN